MTSVEPSLTPPADLGPARGAPRRWARAGALGGLALLLTACGGAPAARPLDLEQAATARAALTEPEVAALLEEAEALWERRRREMLLAAVDENERFDSLYGPSDVEYLLGLNDYATLFRLGDEAFEAERDRAAGFGAGSSQGPPPLPAVPRRVHDGERGGLDAASCRGCHFQGGPDGSGTATQVGLFRGDGTHLSSASVRDAPHVMGLGYLQALAEWWNLSLEAQAITYQLQAEATGQPLYAALEVDGVGFGNATFYPDGTIGTAGLRAISEDLRVRPFGHKGRHETLVDLVDEALQVHHGHQSTSREATFADEAERYLGPGPAGDRDLDGVVNEATDAQAVVLASYLSMLPIPVMRAPERVDLQQRWGRGAAVFDEVGCAECHRTDLRLQIDSFLIEGAGDSTLSVFMAPLEVGLAPRPEHLDFGNPDPGTPLYAFTDLRRHEMGPALADATGEPLPGDLDEVAADLWLTRPLWGLADTAPYLHDGRAPTVHDAIVRHGGEADAARLAYLDLSDEDRAALLVFLASLTREATVLVE